MHTAAGFLVGTLVGLTGVGGGSLMTPLLILLFGVGAQTAVGTDLLFAAITKITGSAVHGWRDNVDWNIARALALGSVPAAVCTLMLLTWVGQLGHSTERVILAVVAAMLAGTAVTVVLRQRLMHFAENLAPRRSPRQVKVATIVLGGLIGVAVTISSVGAGAIGISALLLLYPRVPIARIIGSDLAHAVPLALIAGAGHWLIGDVDGRLLLHLLAGSLPGVVAGSLLSTRASGAVLRHVLAAVLAVSALQLGAKLVSA